MDKKYGKKIREIREKNKDTLEELAKKLDVTWSALGKFERGERKITPGLLEKVAEVYNVPITFFFGEVGKVPDGLKELGVDWITFVEEMEDKSITPSEIKAVLETIKIVNKLKQ